VPFMRARDQLLTSQRPWRRPHKKPAARKDDLCEDLRKSEIGGLSRVDVQLAPHLGLADLPESKHFPGLRRLGLAALGTRTPTF